LPLAGLAELEPTKSHTPSSCVALAFLSRGTSAKGTSAKNFFNLSLSFCRIEET